MAAVGGRARGSPGKFWDCWWPYVLDFCLTLWVLRAPVATLAIGALLMWFVPQAQDLLVEFAMPGEGWARTAEFLLLILFVWAMPTHYSARLLVRTDERFVARLAERGTAFLPFLQKWTPRALGAFTFVIMLGGALRAWRNLPLIADTDLVTKIGANLILVSALLAVVGVVFWLYAVYRERIADTAAIGSMERLAGVAMRPLRRLLPAISRRGGGAGSHLGPLLLVLMFLAFAAAPIAFPLWFATMMPRALAVPFVLGGWLPLLTYLAALGRRLCAPFILMALVIFALLPLGFGDNYAIRLINAATMVTKITGKDAPAGVTDAIDLKDAINWWKKANGCDSGQKSCPRPIIIASAGGASRAGFFEASVIGQLLDDRLKIDGKGHGLTEQAMANRLFALSTVSGSSVGAVTTVAAMAAVRDGGGEPCTQTEEPLWRGSKIDGWRSCLEALMAGDFLTPIFTGFVFHDIFGFVKWRDRGTLLEELVEREFAKLIGEKPQNPDQLACVGSLECPFTTLRPGKDHWLPLLLLNSTSVTSGQRMITSALEWHIDLTNQNDCPTDNRALTCQIFQRAPLFHDLLAEYNLRPLDDIRLSTAAHNSARFPLLSPPGELIDSTGGLIDRLVDGGYFENFGAQTATELVLSMRALDPNLKPFILVLSNDPQAIVPKKTLPPDNSSPRTLLPDISGPLGAVANTRNARGKLAVDNAADALDHANPILCNTVTIRVWTKPVSDKANAPARDLSMSWWLSKPVQTYLHEQTDFDGAAAANRQKNGDAVAALLVAIRGDTPPAGAKALCPEEVD